MPPPIDPRSIYRAFSALPGSEHIATAYAIEQLVHWVRRTKPRRVLEMGAGIGTMTFALCLLAREIGFELVTVEDHDFCLGELRRNLSGFDGEYRLATSLDQVDLSSPFDFICIDGGAQDERLVAHVATSGTIFIEGFMDKKHHLIHQVHAGKRSYAWANFRPSHRRTKGCWVFRFEPSASERVRFAVRSFGNRVYSALKTRGLIRLRA